MSNLRNRILTFAASSGATLLVAGTCPQDVLALSGGGISPIGVPSQVDAVNIILDGAFDNRCQTASEDSERIQQRRSDTGPVIDVTASFPGDLPTDTDEVVTHSDDTGTFWATATSRSRNRNNERPRVDGEVFWTQTFTKDTPGAFVHFTVSKAALSRIYAATGLTNGGACARINATVSFTLDTGEFYTIFFEDALLRSDLTDPADFRPKGDMTYVINKSKENGVPVATVIFDKFTGNIDLSDTDLHQHFTVTFAAKAVAGTGQSEFPAETIASYRDPITLGGGISIETDGVTPLNSATVDLIPRDRSHAVIIQPDGKIITAGSAFNGNNYDFALARYNTDGTLDATFGKGGKVITDFGGPSDQATAIALQSDKKIVVAGMTDQGQGNANDLAVARYDTDGTLDTSFGSVGKQVLDLAGDDDVVTAIAIQPDGKMLIAGVTGRNGGRDFLLARLDVDGSLDTAGLAPLGWVRTDFAGGADVAKSVAIQGDGKIVLAGYSDQASTATRADFALARFNSDGSLDSTFGAGGKTTTDFGSSDDYIEAISIQPKDGKLVVAGHSSVGPTADFAFARYNTDGRPDATFGSGGRLTADIAGDQDYAYALALQTDGKIVAAGYSAGANSDFAVMRLTAAGTLDSQFGSGGTKKIDFSGGDDEADSVAVQADGKIIVAGWAATATGDDFAVVRLTP